MNKLNKYTWRYYFEVEIYKIETNQGYDIAETLLLDKLNVGWVAFEYLKKEKV